MFYCIILCVFEGWGGVSSYVRSFSFVFKLNFSVLTLRGMTTHKLPKNQTLLSVYFFNSFFAGSVFSLAVGGAFVQPFGPYV
jgi:hypothetical protein